MYSIGDGLYLNDEELDTVHLLAVKLGYLNPQTSGRAYIGARLQVYRKVCLEFNIGFKAN